MIKEIWSKIKQWLLDFFIPVLKKEAVNSSIDKKRKGFFAKIVISKNHHPVENGEKK